MLLRNDLSPEHAARSSVRNGVAQLADGVQSAGQPKSAILRAHVANLQGPHFARCHKKQMVLPCIVEAMCPQRAVQTVSASIGAEDAYDHVRRHCWAQCCVALAAILLGVQQTPPHNARILPSSAAGLLLGHRRLCIAN